jgi:hypothetical protein
MEFADKVIYLNNQNNEWWYLYRYTKNII